MIIVTGASRGLGKAISERLIKSGEKVIGLTRSAQDLNFKNFEISVKFTDSLNIN